ncbi:MAG: YfhO family protein [Vagococcus sp.]|uniref:YfhO family protein n=1 Tax=Vagococcus sp. TaxID=1933889 RepID=UPI002FC73908
MNKKNKLIAYLISFIIPIVVLASVWMILGLAPFGNNNLMVSDLGSQYLPFLNAFKRFMTEGGENLYSFANGIGGPMEATIAYYLMSPFNFISLLFPYNMMPVAVLLIITLKIACMSLTMYTYLDLHYRQSNWLTQAFSLAYSLCGFVVVYLLNFMWLDVLILFPLLVLGLERLWHEKKYGLYGVTLFFSILTNYYLGYMVCIFAVMYSVFIYYLKFERKPAKSIKEFTKRWRLFFVTSLLSGLSTAFMLIPAILGMLQTGKSSFHMQDFLLKPRFGFEVFSQMGLGTINYDIRLDHLPMIYSGVFVWLLAFLYFTLPIVPKRKKRAMAALLTVIYFSFFFEMFNTVWHMFQSPAGFPYRNAFIFSFILIKLAYETYLYARLTEDKTIVKKRLVLAGSTFTVLLTIGQLFLIFQSDSSYLLSNTYFVLNIVIVWILVFVLRLKFTKTSYLWRWVLLLCVGLELGGNLWISMKDIPFGNQEQYAKMYNEQEMLVKHLESGRDDLFRINQKIDTNMMGYNEINNGYNNPMLFGYSGVSSYTSTLDSKVQNTLTDLGLYSKNERRFSYVDESQVANLLLNVNYTINPKFIDNKELLEEQALSNIYKNSEAIGAAFLAPKALKEVSLERGKVINNQETILQSIKPLQNDVYFKPLTGIHTTKEVDKYQIKGKVTADGTNYLYLPNAVWDNVEYFAVNGKEIKTDVMIITNQLFNLGEFKKNDQIRLELKLNKKIETTDMVWVSLDQSKFDKLIHYQKNYASSLTWQKLGKLEGKVNVVDENQLLYVSIPYDKNWQVEVDGKKVKPKQIVGDFIGLDLEMDEHQINFKYRSKSLMIGLVITSISLLISFIGVIFTRKIKSKEKQIKE